MGIIQNKEMISISLILFGFLYIATATPECPPGPKGDPGLPGVRGRDGFPGMPGAKGDRGRNCLECPAGPGGAIGPKGQKGMRGDDGIPGLSGMKGYPGDRGRRGRPGPKGDAGLPGVPGIKGFKGECACPHLITTTTTQSPAKDDEQSANQPVKSSPVAFHGYARNNTRRQTYRQVIQFSEIISNEGGLLEGEEKQADFEIPESGVYMFHVASTNPDSATPIVLLLNDAVIMQTGNRGNVGEQLPVGSNHVIKRANRGDDVKLMVEGHEHAEVMSSVLSYHISFSAFLIG